MIPARTNAVLCERVRCHNDPEAFRHLIDRHRRQLYHVVNEFTWARALVPEDHMVQECLLAFWHAARDYEHNWTVPYGAVASHRARQRAIGAVREARQARVRILRDSTSLEQPVTADDPEGGTYADVIPAPEYWQPEVMSEIRHDLRVLATELSTGLSETEREALTRVMLDEKVSASDAAGRSARQRMQRKASRALGYEWRSSPGSQSAERRKERALAMLRDGRTPGEVSRSCRVAASTVREWQKAVA